MPGPHEVHAVPGGPEPQPAQQNARDVGEEQREVAWPSSRRRSRSMPPLCACFFFRENHGWNMQGVEMTIATASAEVAGPSQREVDQPQVRRRHQPEHLDRERC